MTRQELLPRELARVARDLQRESGSADTMDLAVKLAVDMVAGAEGGGITLVRGGLVETPAATDEWAAQLDQIQHQLGQGPSLTAAHGEDVVSCPDVAAESRWGQWGARTAGETAVRSMMCFRLFTHTEEVGSLNLHAMKPHAFTGADVDTGVALAAHTAIAIVTARSDENKDIAIDSRSLIGQATGIIMDRFDLDGVRAFAVLRRISQTTNTKLHQVAAEVVRTRKLPVL